ncbi:hypothetical protein VKT23_019164 [Stygiomarasmius scandens]|uniref:Uncharacterized protein n=1 Tax=Marasmiellus scandens TaxID=2682957 RepID=A0ABR1IIS8_9AGAR
MYVCDPPEVAYEYPPLEYAHASTISPVAEVSDDLPTSGDQDLRPSKRFKDQKSHSNAPSHADRSGLHPHPADSATPPFTFPYSTVQTQQPFVFLGTSSQSNIKTTSVEDVVGIKEVDLADIDMYTTQGPPLSELPLSEICDVQQVDMQVHSSHSYLESPFTDQVAQEQNKDVDFEAAVLMSTVNNQDEE